PLYCPLHRPSPTSFPTRRSSDLLPHPGQKLIGFGAEGKQRDPEIFVWSFAWWPHAIAHWTNPLFTHEIYAPTGINLTWTTSVPRSEEHTSELQSLRHLVCRLLLE